jgi:hypothetical protein
MNISRSYQATDQGSDSVAAQPGTRHGCQHLGPVEQNRRGQVTCRECGQPRWSQRQTFTQRSTAFCARFEPGKQHIAERKSRILPEHGVEARGSQVPITHKERLIHEIELRKRIAPTEPCSDAKCTVG